MLKRSVRDGARPGLLGWAGRNPGLTFLAAYWVVGLSAVGVNAWRTHPSRYRGA